MLKRDLGDVVVVIALYLDLQLPMQSAPINLFGFEFESRSCDVYSIQHHMIKFVCDLRKVGGLFRALWFPTPIKLTATI